jgi:hypothetical protein
MQGEIWMCVTQRGNLATALPAGSHAAVCWKQAVAPGCRVSRRAVKPRLAPSATGTQHCRVSLYRWYANPFRWVTHEPQKLGRSAGRQRVRVVCSDGSQDSGRCPTHGHVVVCSMQYRVTAVEWRGTEGGA